MGFSDDIRTIAKTKELEEKVAKALKDAEDAQKAAISASRSMATQTGDNSKGIQTGAPGGDQPINATLPSGAQQSTPPNNTNPPSQSNSTSTSGLGGASGASDALKASDVANAVDRMNGGGGAGGKTDLSGNASSGNNPGGTDALNIGKGGAGDTVLSSLIAKAQADGQPTTTIQRMIDTYLAAKFPHNGTKTAKEIADNANTVPQLKATSDPELLYPGSSLGKERLNAVIGYVADGATSAVTGKMKMIKAQFRGGFPTPSAADAAAAGQGSWLGPSDPPLLANYNAGRVWEIANGGTSLWDQTFQGMIAQREAIGPTKAYTIVGGLVSSTTPSAGDALIQFSSNLTATVGTSSGAIGGTQYVFQAYSPGVTVGVSKYGQQDCGLNALSNAVCALPAPREIAWPKTGIFVMLLLNGVFGGNPFDTERPAVYNYDTSRIRMKVGDGVDVVDSRYLDLEVGAKGGYLVSTYASNGTTFQEGKYYDSNGALLVVGISEAEMKFYRPRF